MRRILKLLLINQEISLHSLIIALQIVVALGIFNVWLIRGRKATAYRGGNAKTIFEEFQTYGLPSFFVYIVGGLKLLAACGLIAGVWLTQLVFPSSLVIAILMVGALSMHLKVGDPIMKSLPAAAMLLMSSLIVVFSS